MGGWVRQVGLWLRRILMRSCLTCCRPEECIYVGDRAVAELRTAKIMGMFTVKVGGRASMWADLHVGDILEPLRQIERLVEGSTLGGA